MFTVVNTHHYVCFTIYVQLLMGKVLSLLCIPLFLLCFSTVCDTQCTICTCIILCYNTVKFILFMFKSYGKCSISTLTLYYLSSPISKPSRVLQKRLLDKQQDTATKKAKLATSIAYKHSSVVPRDVDVQNFRIFVGRLRC